MELGQAVFFRNNGLADIDKKHLNLNGRPPQPKHKGSSGQPDKTPHDDISEDVAALLETSQFGPRAVGALQIYPSNTLETGSDQLILDVQDGMEVGTKGSKSIPQKSQEIAPSVWLVT